MIIETATQKVKGALGHLTWIFLSVLMHPRAVVAAEQVKIKWYQPQIVGDPERGAVHVMLSGETAPRAGLAVKIDQILQLKGGQKSQQNVQKLIQSCKVYRTTDASSEVLETLPKGGTLWVEMETSEWGKVQRESGVGYISKECLSPQSADGGAEERRARKRLLRTKSDEEGYFELQLRLPLGVSQIPVQIYKTRQQRRILQILLEVRSDGVKINAKVHKNLKLERETSIRYWIEGGVGYTSQKIDHEQGGKGALSVGLAALPSISIRGGLHKGRWGGAFQYTTMPGQPKEAQTNGEVAASNNYAWQMVALNGSFLFKEKLLFSKDQWFGTLGLQQHNLPFVDLSSSGSATFLTPSLMALALGVSVQSPFATRWSCELGLSYLYPVSSSGSSGVSFSVQPKLSYELSGFAYFLLNRQMRMGGGILRQTHSHNFDSTDSSGQSSSGTQSLTFYDLAFRFRYDF